MHFVLKWYSIISIYPDHRIITIQIDDKILPSFLFLISDGELYSATVSDFSGSDPLIYKRALENDQEPLRTDQFDSKHLNCK